MLRYVLAAQALKAFSCTQGTRNLYRKLGNDVFARKRVVNGLPETYVQRAHDHLKFLQSHGVIADGMRGLELGPGWVHWDSTFLRLFHDMHISLFDVWDNRQFDAFHRYITDFKAHVGTSVDVGAAGNEKARELIDKLAKAGSFEDVYELLGFDYNIDANGSLGGFADDTFDLIYSSDVLEHVDETILEDYIKSVARILKPGGCTYHQIVIADHLCIYDRSVNEKNYLRYSDKQWRRWFNNDVQYINRVQNSEWLRMFDDAGLEQVAHEITVRESIENLNIDPQFAGLSKDDLESTVVRVLYRKPL